MILGIVVRLYMLAALVQSLLGDIDACSRMMLIANRLADSDRLGSGVLIASCRKCAARLLRFRRVSWPCGVAAARMIFLIVPWYLPVSGAADCATTVDSRASCRS